MVQLTTRAIRTASILGDFPDGSRKTRVRLSLHKFRSHEGQDVYRWLGDANDLASLDGKNVLAAMQNLYSAYRSPAWGLRTSWV